MVNRVTTSPFIARPGPLSQRAASSSATSFASVLESELDRGGAIRFSAHAQNRLQTRQINLSQEELAQVDQAVNQAAAKGSRESLLLMDRVALVVNVPNRTVITALTTGEAQSNVFTNIDSAIVMPGRPALSPAL